MGRNYTPWILVLVLGCMLTFHIQLFALFFTDRDWQDDDIYCHSNVEITFSNESFQLPKTEDELMNEWFSMPKSKGRVMYNRRQMKNYLSVGIAIHHFNPNDDKPKIERTLDSVVNKTSTYEKLHNVIIVIISRHLSEENERLIITLIVQKYLYEINIGYLHIFQPSSLFNQHSLIVGSKCDFGNGGDMKYVSSHTLEKVDIWKVDMCFQLESMYAVSPHAQSLSENYLHLDDSVEAISNFVGTVREFIRIQKANSRNWGILEFSGYDFVGNLMRSRDIVKFVQFFAMSEMLNKSLEDTFELYFRLLSQKSRLLRTPEVFQRISITSPGIQLNDDDDETRWLADDPPGIVITDMKHVGSHIPSLVYGSKPGYFKALMPQINDWIVIVFDDDVDLRRIKIRTGEKSLEVPKQRESGLLQGVFEASPKVLRMDVSKNFVTCADFVKIGNVRSGVAEVSNFTKSLWGRKTRCLKLTINDANGRDIIFHQIAVYI